MSSNAEQIKSQIMTTKEIELALNPNQAYLKRTALYFTRDHQDAEDLFQETMYRAISKIHLFKPGTNFKNWSTTIMRNIFLSNKRRSKRYTSAAICEKVQASDQFADDNAGEYSLFAEEVEQAMDILRDSDRKMIEMLRAGYSYNEIADETDKPLGTVKCRIHLSRKRLKKQMEDRVAMQ